MIFVILIYVVESDDNHILIKKGKSKSKRILLTIFVSLFSLHE